jgi:hypothetical protein
MKMPGPPTPSRKDVAPRSSGGSWTCWARALGPSSKSTRKSSLARQLWMQTLIMMWGRPPQFIPKSQTMARERRSGRGCLAKSGIAAGHDAQLEKTVEVLKEELKGKRPEAKTASGGE